MVRNLIKKFEEAWPWIRGQLSEPSTWRGLVLVVSALGVVLSPEQKEAFVSAGLGLAGLIGALSSDRKAIARAEEKIEGDIE